MTEDEIRTIARMMPKVLMAWAKEQTAERLMTLPPAEALEQMQRYANLLVAYENFKASKGIE